MSSSLFHPLHTTLPLPERFTYPFCYEPHPLCLLAADELQHYIRREPSWQEEIAEGKMFGVLVAEDADGQLGYLAAYSGQLCQRNDLPFFVPAVYDMLQPDGPFKTGERQITAVNHEVERLEHGDRRQELLRKQAQIQEEQSRRTADYRRKMDLAKRRRDAVRQAAAEGNGRLDAAEEEALVRESQFMKAELRRIKKQYAAQLQAVAAQLADSDAGIDRLKRRRRQMSDRLQRWLFSQFRMLNARGEERDLCDIFAHTVGRVPPSGAGECCAPKLLQYAYRQGLRPVCMAEFWWGASPKAEVRHHLHYYPACRGKCKPILEHMLQGLDVDLDPLAEVHHRQLGVLFEDAYLAVVCKPEGMLSVPGKGNRPSVLTEMQRRCPDARGPMIVHRLDMDTSGLMVVAKDMDTYLGLQRQFAARSIRKRYVALLAHCPAGVPREGIVSLLLRPDPLDRPRQVVDSDGGKEAVSEYHILKVLPGGQTLVSLSPHTGRTHQLRVHCAHPAGLGAPIVGDRLYGQPAGRLCLHAEYLELTHPHTGRRMSFMQEADFI